MALSKFNFMLAVLVVAYISVLGWYLKSTVAPNKKKHRKKSSSRKSKSKHRIAGKICPKCKKTIDRRRTVCQHCGHKFELAPGTPPHPDEVKAGIVPAPEDAEDKEESV